MKASDLNPGEYSSYFGTYISQSGDKELVPSLEKGLAAMRLFYESIPEEKMEQAYAEGKWTIKELLLHIIDAERVFAYRALRFARGDKTDLPGFEQDDYVMTSEANSRSKESLIDEYKAVRSSTIALFKSFNDKMIREIGSANNIPTSAAAMGFVILGHENHHVKIIQERYL